MGTFRFPMISSLGVILNQQFHDFSCKASRTFYKVIWEALKYCIPLRGLAENMFGEWGPDFSFVSSVGMMLR